MPIENKHGTELGIEPPISGVNPVWAEEFDRRHQMGQQNGLEITQALEAEGIPRVLGVSELRIDPDDPNKASRISAVMVEKIGNRALPSVVTKQRVYHASKRPLGWRERRRA